MKYKKCFLSFFLFCLVGSGVALSQTESREQSVKANAEKGETAQGNGTPVNNVAGSAFYRDPTQNRTETTSYSFFFFKVLIVLVVFALMGYALVRFFRKQGGFSPSKGGPIEVIHTYPLEMGKTLKVIKVVNDLILVSSSQEGLRFLMKIEDKESIDVLKLERDRKESIKGGFFTDIFSKYVNVQSKNPIDITKKLREKLQKKKDE